MANCLNKVTLIGNLGDDPKIHHFDNSKCLTRFRIATNERLKRVDGSGYTHTEWHSIVVKNSKLAEVCHKTLSKGDRVYIDGKVRTRLWESAEGVERKVVEILCMDMILLSTKIVKEKEVEKIEETDFNTINEDDIDVSNLEKDIFDED